MRDCLPVCLLIECLTLLNLTICLFVVLGYITMYIYVYINFGFIFSYIRAYLLSSEGFFGLFGICPPFNIYLFVYISDFLIS